METEADTCGKYVRPRLRDAGWTNDLIFEQKPITHGRIKPLGHRHVRQRGLRADYLLSYTPDLPLAVVEAKRSSKHAGDGLQQAMRYAEMLGLKFAYATNGIDIIEHDFITGKQQEVTAFPSPAEIWQRLQAHLNFTPPEIADDYLAPLNRELRNPDGSIRVPHYYQRVAIDRAVQAVLSGRERILLTMATGTGKTFVAVQIAWKLWKTGRKRRILYLADRDILVQQPLTREFSIFGDAVCRIQGQARKGREIYFALYQSIADDPDRPGLYRSYPRDYFDLILVDECHRGSARDESSWRKILEYFASATQIGMTATPKRDANVDTYEYFGSPVYVYSLAQGIEDGFLAPFRVYRIVPSVDATGWRPTADQRDRLGRLIPDQLYTTADYERLLAILARTEVVAHHLTAFLKRADRFAKTIVFCVDQEHAERMRLAMHQANEDLTRDHPHYVARVVSDEGDLGRAHLDDFQDPEKSTPVVVTTSQLLTTGVDIPTCKNIVLFKPIRSMVEFKQIIGRGTRICEERGKLWFNILDYAGVATRLFADPEFDGPPDFEKDIRIDERGDPIEEPGDGPADGGASEVVCGDDEREPRKYYVDGVPVFITAEVEYEVDAHGRRVQPISYTDYTAGQVRTLFGSAAELRSHWTSAQERAAILAALDQHGVDPVKLAADAGRPDADLLDLLIHVAWQGPLRTRQDRVARVKQRQDFFQRFSAQARAVLNDLLEKYAEHGVGQLDDLQVLEVPPISARGSVVEIAQAFGGPEALKTAVAELQALIYAA